MRELIFMNDSTYSETVSGSLGSIKLSNAKYHFINDSLVLEGVKSKIVFFGNDKFKFSIAKQDSVDLLYMLIFERR